MKRLHTMLVMGLIVGITTISYADTEPVNLVANGEFEEILDTGGFVDWKMSGPNTIIGADGENHYLTVAKTDSNFVPWVEQTIELDPAWTKLKIATRMKATDLQIENEGQTPKVVGLVLDAAGKSLGYLNTPSLKRDSDWVSLATEAELPDGAAKLKLFLANFAAKGEACFDDVTITVAALDKKAAVATSSKTWYVDDIAQNGDGSRENPFNRIQAAADVAKAGDTVIIREGVYRETVTPRHSGNPVNRGTYITYKAAEGETVIVSGADPITTKWTAGNGVYQTTVATTFESRLNQAEQLFADGEMMVLARHPNTQFNSMDLVRAPRMHSDNVTHIGITPGKEKRMGWHRLKIEDDELTMPTGTLDGATIYFTPRAGEGDQGGGWGFARGGIVLSQKKGELTADIVIGRKFDRKQFSGGEPYFVTNTKGLLDKPGEWLRQDDTLFLNTSDGTSPASKRMEIKRRDYAFDLTGLSYIRIQGITVFAATITTDHDASPLKGKGGGSHMTDRGRKDIAPAHHIVLDGIHFQYVNHVTDQTAWEQGQWIQTSGVVISGSYHTVKNCLIEFSAVNGMLVIGQNHLITNNIIHDTNYAGTFGAALSMGMESTNYDCEISHNTVYTTGFDGIMTQALRSRRRSDPARVHHNRVSGFGFMSRDVGAIKVVGHHPQINGTRWDHNRVSDGGGWSIGIYHDFTTDFLIDHNTAWNVEQGCNINDAIRHRIYNNTFLGHKSGIGGTHHLRETIASNNIVSQQMPDEKSGCKFQKNIENADASLFIDRPNEDFRLRPGSPAVDAGKPIPGITQSKDDTPDCGAHEPSNKNWIAGATLPLPIEPPTKLVATRNEKRQVKLNWQDNADNERHYYVERCLKPTPQSGYFIFHTIAELPANSTTWSDNDPNAAFYAPRYRIRADRSIYSNTVRTDPLGLSFHLSFENELSNRTALKYNINTSKAPAEFAAEGQSGAALYCDADKTSFIVVQNHPGLNPAAKATFSVWIKPRRWSGGNRLIFNKGIHKDEQYFLHAHGNKLRFQISPSWYEAVESTELPPVGKWTHIAATADQEKIRLYINGALVDTRKYSAGIPVKNKPLTIGGKEGATRSASYFDGLIDDFRIYHGVALTPDEIARLAQQK